MKKIIALLLVAVLSVFVLAACAPSECEICGKEADTEKIEYNGESAYACEDCAALFNLGVSILEDADVDINDLID